MTKIPRSVDPHSLDNLYCTTLSIAVPRVEAVVDHPEAHTFALLLVALLERGSPMSLGDVATRLAQAGAGSRQSILRALRRCRPGRPPVYRQGQRYGLDPYDEQLDLWVFRLGLRPPKVPAVSVVREPPPPPPDDHVPLSRDELRTAWKDASLASWSAQRLAVAVLDAHARAMAPGDVVAFVTHFSQQHRLTPAAVRHWHHGAITVTDEGHWAVHAAHPAVPATRHAVRRLLQAAQRYAETRQDPAVMRAYRQAYGRHRAAHNDTLAALSRVILHAFPRDNPKMVVLLDVTERLLTTYGPHERAAAIERAASYDVIASLDVRQTLTALGMPIEGRRLADLTPAQKTRRIDDRGTVLKITAAMLIEHSCRIGNPLGDIAKMRGYVRKRQWSQLRRRMEADAKALYAFYQYGRLHGHVRLRRGFIDESMPAPWVHRDETTLYSILQDAEASKALLEVVAGSAPGWANPWAHAQRCRVHSAGPYIRVLIDQARHQIIDPDDVYLVRPASAPKGRHL